MPSNTQTGSEGAAPQVEQASLKSAPDLVLSCLVHDLNNVFQTLMEAADLLSDDPHWADVSGAILRSIERGKEISSSLLTVDQPSAPLETVLRNAADFVLDSVRLGHGPDIQFSYDIDTGLELRHSWAWERVFINLFVNAVRAMPRGGTISVDASRNDRRIEIRVADEGSGIPSALLSKIFEPHVSDRANGGLGLHIVKTIVAEHDGEVHAANREDHGAEFFITIPDKPRRAKTARA